MFHRSRHVPVCGNVLFRAQRSCTIEHLRVFVGLAMSRACALSHANMRMRVRAMWKSSWQRAPGHQLNSTCILPGFISLHHYRRCVQKACSSFGLPRVLCFPSINFFPMSAAFCLQNHSDSE